MLKILIPILVAMVLVGCASSANRETVSVEKLIEQNAAVEEENKNSSEDKVGESVSDPILDEALGLLEEGKELSGRGEIDAAIRKYEKVLELYPEWVRTRYQLGMLLYNGGLTFLQTAGDIVADVEELALSERLKERLLKRAAAQRRRGAFYFGDALRHLKKVEKAYADDYELLLTEARICRQLGKIDQAGQYLDRASETGAPHELIETEKNLLEATVEKKR